MLLQGTWANQSDAANHLSGGRAVSIQRQILNVFVADAIAEAAAIQQTLPTLEPAQAITTRSACRSQLNETPSSDRRESQHDRAGPNA
jgi:hypothetical protein